MISWPGARGIQPCPPRAPPFSLQNKKKKNPPRAPQGGGFCLPERNNGFHEGPPGGKKTTPPFIPFLPWGSPWPWPFCPPLPHPLPWGRGGKKKKKFCWSPPSQMEDGPPPGVSPTPLPERMKTPKPLKLFFLKAGEVFPPLFLPPREKILGQNPPESGLSSPGAPLSNFFPPPFSRQLENNPWGKVGKASNKTPRPFVCYPGLKPILRNLAENLRGAKKGGKPVQKLEPKPWGPDVL